MIKIVWNAVLLGVIAVAAAWLSNNSGSIQIDWIGYRVQTSVAVVIGSVVILYAVFYVFLARPLLIVGQKLSYWFGADKRADKLAKSKIGKEVDKYTLLGRGLTALAAGDIADAEKLRKRIVKAFADEPEKTIVFEAQLAEAKNDTARAMALYNSLTEDPDTKLLGLRGKIRLYRMGGNSEKALELCRDLLDSKNVPAWVLSEAFELQIQEKQWKDAIETLERSYKLGLFDKGTVKRLKASVLLEEAEETADLGSKEKLVRAACDTDDAYLPAVLKTAEYDIAKDDKRKARKLLQKMWKNAPCWPVYETYLTLFADVDAIQTVKEVDNLISENKTAVLNDLVHADVSLRARLWGEAGTAVEKYLAGHPDSKRALAIAAEIADHMQNPEKSKEYREKAALAATEPVYKCSVCMTPFDAGYTICPVCHALGTINVAD